MKKFWSQFGSRSGKNYPDPLNSDPDLAGMKDSFKNLQFSFREGFPDRVVARLENILTANPEEIYLRYLSRLLPKIAGFSLGVVITMILLIFALHGTLSPDKLIGADRVDDSNFITFLIMQN